MLYIFHVDSGTTITFDIKLALQTVSQLKEAIERECGVVAANQVLLMSGGESLDPSARVCSYSAGTDTNPIYLFSTSAIESHVPPTSCIDYGSDFDLQNQIDASLVMPATYQTIVARAQLAQQCYGLAREQTRICERLVHDQHLQQQGWAAVVANLEDLTHLFQSRADILQQTYTAYLSERQQHIDLLANFSHDLDTLSKIPLLPALRAQAEGLLSPDEQPSQSENDSEGRKEVLNLLRWISVKDNQSNLEQVVDYCTRGLGQYDERVMEALKTEVNIVLDSANKQDMKEIKGLGERLFALEQLMIQTKKLVQVQGELTQGFLQNQSRANNLGDASILPDLCALHRRQLLVMQQNHNKLRDIRRRCTKAKEELSVNIYHRLKWIMYVENKMKEMDRKLVMYHESLKRIRRYLEVLQQIHLAPQMYMNAVAEVVRRRTFSQAFLVWASNLACQLLTVHSEELTRRREFQSKFDGHFLNLLFPGLEDTPPPFATQAPSVFDNGLPKLTVEDIESLRSQLPDLALTISSPDLISITQFFLSKSLTEASTEGNKEKDSTSMRVDVAVKDQDQTTAPMLFDRGGFESETDTEEFEKIGQGAADSKPESYDGVKQMRQKQLEVGASRSVSPASSTSTNVSPLNSKVADLTNRSSSSSEPGSFHFPSLSVSERPAQLSPLTECAENGESSCLHRATTTNGFPSNKYNHEAPSATMEDEPNSSLSPNPPCSPLSRSVMCDGQQQQCHQLSGSGGSSPSVGVGATDFVGTEFYMDESLPSSLSEHPADGHHQAIVSLLQENLGNTREEVERLRTIVKTMKALVGESLTTLRQELSVLRDRSDEEMCGSSKMIDRIREVLSLYSCECDRRVREREQELTVDHELEMTDVKKLIESREEEIRTLKRDLLEKETELAEYERLMATMRSKLENEQDENRDLKARMEEALNDQQRLVKEATDKLQIEYKAELESIRSRFKLMAASTCAMERSPSDSSLEKIDKPDFIELVNHAFGHSMQESKLDKSVTLRSVEKECGDCISKLVHELRIATQVFEEKVRDVEMYRKREMVLTEECKRYKNTIKQLMKSESYSSALVDSGLHKESSDEQLKMSQTSLEEVAKSLEPDKDEVEVSESKKVRLETTDDSYCMSRRMEMLENENKRLNSELKSLRESKQTADAKIEILEADTMRLEVELVKERYKYFITPDSSSSSESRDKDTSASVAMASKSVIRRDAATSTGPLRRCTCTTCLTRIQKRAKKFADKLVELGHITVTRCNPGDHVLMFWDPNYWTYMLYQESMTMYFLNSDCLAPGIDIMPDGTPRPTQHIVQVIDKQYCHARKSENRYRVPSGTKFYQVNVELVKESAAILSSIQQK
ncbi:RB1-inducible coiled-coil protein 1 isoform X1 [Ceratina calcarata]|uniref:RB1-inducible coiled-coil protein 1 n=1 Tax=Ceratina calcarata TaxID=156304 RepID=A0AAJ7N615_9HYME|nr:RB1-inducible coiled-coil protein 1 isoform X1 [Ceratina calcarata]